ncbi:unknown [Ruminococcus sp. CAG:403]|mgnify:FL=1|nr:unknown [Ruminococcus sp. CAG:403]
MSLGIHQQHSLDFGVERAEKDCKITPHMIEYTKENFIKAAVEFCTDESGIVSISNKYHIAPGTIKKAAAVLLSKEYEQRMS